MSSQKSTQSAVKSSKEGSPGVFAENSTMAAIQKRDKLIVGINFDSPPFAYDDEATGSHAGIDVALAKNIASGIFGKQIENKIEYVEYHEDELDLALRNNNIDIALGRYAITPARKQFIAFAGPYYVSRQATIIRSRSVSSSDRIQSLIDLNGRKVCTVRGSTDIEMLREELPQAQLQQPKNSVGECAADLASGAVDAIIADNVDEARTVEFASSEFKVLSTEFGNRGAKAYGVGIKLEARDLRQYVNDRIENWKDYDTIVKAETGKVPGGAVTKPKVDRY